MFSAEKEFCRAMKALWGTGVKCVVGYPDERWVQSTAFPKACVFVDELELVAKAGDRSAVRTAGSAPTTEYRSIGDGEMVLEVRLGTDNSESQLNALTLEFLEEFCDGDVFGPDDETDRFQIAGPVRARKVRGPEGGPRLTERLFLVPVKGPLEESSGKYEVETTELDDEVGPTV